jgi:hypothetical protein
VQGPARDPQRAEQEHDHGRDPDHVLEDADAVTHDQGARKREREGDENSGGEESADAHEIRITQETTVPGSTAWLG